MPARKDVSSLKSFLGSVQFYAKFLPSTYATEAKPLFQFKRKQVDWLWGPWERRLFRNTRSFCRATKFSSATTLIYSMAFLVMLQVWALELRYFTVFRMSPRDPLLTFPKLFLNLKAIIVKSRKKAVAIIFAVKKFFQCLFGQKFILITDHKPLQFLVTGSRRRLW